MKSFREKRNERKAARAERTERSENLRDWFEKRREASAARAKLAREERNSSPRGVDRVPARLRNIGTLPEMVYESQGDDNYATRRASAKRFRTRNEMGRVEKVQVRSGDNRPYYSPKRDANS